MDYSKEIFPLNHFALYCKGWYEPVDKSTDQFEFVSKILYMDGYCFAKSKFDILNILLAELDRYNGWMNIHKTHYLNFQSFYLQSKNNQRLFNCDIETAMLKTIMFFLHTRSNSEMVLTAPIYNRKLYKKGITFNHKNTPGTTYKEKNNYAHKIFNK